MRKINVVIVGVEHDHAHDAFLYITNKDSSFNLLGIVIEGCNNNNYERWKSDYDSYPRLTVQEVLQEKRLDAVIVETDDTFLTYCALQFAAKNIPVHMDKPGGQDKREFSFLIEICRKNNVPLHLGYMYRYNPSIKTAIEICKSGAIGEIYSIEAQMSLNHPLEKRKWLNEFKGGMMNFLGCHLVDIIVAIQGKPDAVTPLNSRSSSDVGMDLGYAILKYGNHYSTITTSAMEYDGFSRRHITISAEKMTIDIAPTEVFRDGDLYSVSTYKAPVIIPGVPIGQITYGPTHRYKDMFEEFASIVRREIVNPYSLEYEELVHNTLLEACGEE